MDEIAESLADFWRKMHDRYPRMQIGLITNFPNWDYTDKLIGYVGRYTDLSGWTYREALGKKLLGDAVPGLNDEDIREHTVLPQAS